MDLQPPSVLAQLPRPLHASTGKTHIGEVYSLADSKKRKRYEVAVAVDGEAVNIYNVQTPKLVTSYAVPPQSSFSCRPCSVRRKIVSKSSVKRQTYGAVNRPEQQIKSFVEETGGNGSSAPVISSSSFYVKDSNSPTVFVGIVPTAAGEEDEKDPFDILSVHQDGRIRRLSPDLKNQRWSMQHSEVAKVCTSHEVHSCFLVEFEDAKKSLFKRRQDLAALALGDLAGSEADEPSILLLVSHPVNKERIALQDVKVQMFSVPGAASERQAFDESQCLKHLLTIDIPVVDGPLTFESRNLQWSFHSGSAGLNLAFEQGFINFDLSQYSPTVTSKFILEDEQFSSIMRISPQSVIGAGKQLVALYDTEYQSVQRSIAAEDVSSAGGSDGQKPQTTFISYFAKLEIAVATKGNILFAFDLSSSHTASGSSLKRPRDGLLIDAIGRGIGSSAAQWDASKKHRTENMALLGFTSPEQVEKWNTLKAELDRLAKAQDANAFDTAVREYFNGTLPRPVNPEMALFLLSKIFSLKDSENTDKLSASSSFQLAIAVWPKFTADWLIKTGHMSTDNVEIALRRSFKPRILPSLPTGSFTQALIILDPTLRTLASVLRGPVLTPPEELSHALKTFLSMARTRSVEEPAKAITGSDSTALPSQAPAQANLRDIFLCLNTSLKKIHTHPLQSIISSLRSLSRQDLISMIHHLRLSLATGGYTARFTENPPTPITPDQTNPPLSLNTISDLLTAAVDAIGPSGWISASDDDADAELDLIADMKSEISAALAGVEEATYLKGILREYLRFTETASTTPASTTSSTTTQATATTEQSTPFRHEKLNGADLLVYTNDDEEGDADAGGKMLPLSLKAVSSDVSKTKMKKSTGEVKSRSSREIGYLRRKAVGKYSFERLVV